jgi:NADH-ubiquinone oxidoreductase chain 4
MGVVVLGVFSNNLQGIEGGILLAIAHGFVSPALFICVGGIIYNRFHTRLIIYYKGLVNIMPLFTVFFFLFILFNSAIPLSLNYIGEFLSLMGVFQQSPVIAILGASTIVLSAAYSIWVYVRISYGSFSNYFSFTNNLIDINKREFCILLPLLILTVLAGIFPYLIIDNLNVSVLNLIYCI